jgi:hypothetical protein
VKLLSGLLIFILKNSNESYLSPTSLNLNSAHNDSLPASNLPINNSPKKSNTRVKYPSFPKFYRFLYNLLSTQASPDLPTFRIFLH